MASGYETRGAGHGLVATVTHTREGGGVRGPKKQVCVPLIDLQFRAPLMNHLVSWGKIA